MNKSYLKEASVFCFLILLPLPSFGAIFHCIDTTAPLKCVLSSNHHNRIAVDSGTVKKVISADCDLSINMESESGQVFLYALSPNPKETAVSVITNTGHVQDIEIKFEKRSPEVIVLIEPKKIEDEVQYFNKSDEIATKDQIIDEILSGVVPKGYCNCEIECVQTEIKRGIFVKVVSMISGFQDEICVYEITNKTNRSQRILEKDLESNNSRWIYLESNKIKPNVKTMLIISYERGLYE